MQSKLNLVPIIYKNQKLIDISEEVKALRFFSSHCRLNSAICVNSDFVDFMRKIESIKSNINVFMLAQKRDSNINGEIKVNEDNSLITYDFQITNNKDLKSQKIIFVPREINYMQPIIKPTLSFTSFNTELIKGKNVLVEKFFKSEQKEIDYYTNFGVWILRDYVKKTQKSFNHLLFTNFFNRSPYYFICESQTSNELFLPSFPYQIMKRQAFLFRKFLNINGRIIKKSKLDCKPYNEITRQDIEALKSNYVNSFSEPTR